MGPGGQEIFLFCLSKKDGSIHLRSKLDVGNEIQFKQNMSSPSPVSDGKTVWVVTGNGVVTAVDMKGKALWHYDLQKSHWKLGLQAGYASSPILYKDKLIIQVLHGMHTLSSDDCIASVSNCCRRP